MLHEIRNKKLVHDRLRALKRSINSGRVLLPPTIARFVFLCGANKSKDEISERRRALMDFSNKHLPHTYFFLAEKMFSTLKEEGHKGNLLDVEHLISDFSDYVLIVLESPSSFAELGAFSHHTLRKKLVVINDEKFEGEESFINFGPIKAINEASGPERIICYKMSSDGVWSKDAIGDTFYKIYELFQKPLKSKAKPAKIDSLHPGKSFDKYSAMFLHDLIFLSGPLGHKEIIELLIKLFGNSNFNNVSHLLAILCAFGSIERGCKGLYRSKRAMCYYEYKFDLSPFIAVFRNYALRKYPERLYAY
ncbi:retron St85 family effector protein [Halomonas elongata]|uniref:retron St85 family effector protein n=1 Tax=Halomonas elongata TaxID=2746 RepID=UPI00334E7CC8